MDDKEFEDLKKRVQMLEEDYKKLRKQMLAMVAALDAKKVDKKQKSELH